LKTPLHVAVRRNHLDVAKILLNHGAKIDVSNKNQETPSKLIKSTEMNQILEKQKQLEDEKKET